MLVNIYCIYDSKSDVYSLPIIYNHDEEFKRAVISLCKQEENALSFVCDNVYYQVGTFDTEQGLLTQIDARKVFTGIEIERIVLNLKKSEDKIVDLLKEVSSVSIVEVCNTLMKKVKTLEDKNKGESDLIFASDIRKIIDFLEKVRNGNFDA